MTDKELVCGLLGLVKNDTSLLIGSLVLLKKEVSLELIAECKDEMNVMIKNLHTLSEPFAKAALADMIEYSRNKSND